jgi:hypothetical protein
MEPGLYRTPLTLILVNKNITATTKTVTDTLSLGYDFFLFSSFFMANE